MSMILNGKKSLLNVVLVEGSSSGGDEYEAITNSIVERTIEQVELPNVTSIGNNAFRNCDKLTSATFPNATSIDSSAFSYCSALTSVSIPNATSIGSYAFNYCTKLTSATFPNATSIGSSAFSYCSALTSVSIPNATSIGYDAFQSCTKLTTITLGANQVCTLQSTSSIPASRTRHITIKVPADLIESYKTATNWSTHYNNGYITFEAIA